MNWLSVLPEWSIYSIVAGLLTIGLCADGIRKYTADKQSIHLKNFGTLCLCIWIYWSVITFSWQ